MPAPECLFGAHADAILAPPPCVHCSMELVARQFPVSNMVLQAYTNYRCSPYLPDIVAIVYNM